MLLNMELGLGQAILCYVSSPWKGAQQPLPAFPPIFNVAKRWPISATAELLFY